MEYLWVHYRQAYEFRWEGGKYRARARFGGNDVLEADDPAGLLLQVRRHYPGEPAETAKSQPD